MWMCQWGGTGVHYGVAQGCTNRVAQGCNNRAAWGCTNGVTQPRAQPISRGLFRSPAQRWSPGRDRAVLARRAPRATTPCSRPACSAGENTSKWDLKANLSLKGQTGRSPIIKGSTTPAPACCPWHFPAGTCIRCLRDSPAATCHLSMGCPHVVNQPPRHSQVTAPAPALHAALCSPRYTFNLHLQLPWCGMRRGFACTSDRSCIPIPSVVTITTSTHVIKVITHTNWACDCMGISVIFFFFFKLGL